MTDREILAQLKKSYENLQDIRENGSFSHCSGQLDSKMTDSLESAIYQIKNIYDDFYDSLDNEIITINKKAISDDINYRRKEHLENVYKIRIDKDISGYYELVNNDGTSDHVGLDVLDNYEWYNDIDYLFENIEKEEDYEM